MPVSAPHFDTALFVFPGGIARVLGGAEWVELAKTHLLTDGE
jgi:hypothetical protein